MDRPAQGSFHPMGQDWLLDPLSSVWLPLLYILYDISRSICANSFLILLNHRWPVPCMAVNWQTSVRQRFYSLSEQQESIKYKTIENLEKVCAYKRFFLVFSLFSKKMLFTAKSDSYHRELSPPLFFVEKHEDSEHLGKHYENLISLSKIHCERFNIHKCEISKQSRHRLLNN